MKEFKNDKVKTLSIEQIDNGFITVATGDSKVCNYSNDSEKLSHKSLGDVVAYILERYTFKAKEEKTEE